MLTKYAKEVAEMYSDYDDRAEDEEPTWFVWFIIAIGFAVLVTTFATGVVVGVSWERQNVRVEAKQ